MVKRRAWVTPNTPPPETERGRCFSVPDDLLLVGAVTGALLPLTQPENWEADGSMTPEEAADIMSAAFEAFVSGDCGGGNGCTLPDGQRIYRRNPDTGNFEYLESGEWLGPSGDELIPTPNAPPGVTDDEKKCSAATNLEYVLHMLWIDTLGFYEDELIPSVAMVDFATSASLLLGSAFYPPLLGIVALEEVAFDSFYFVMDALTENMWDSYLTESLICLFKSNASVVDGKVHFDLKGIQADLWTDAVTFDLYLLQAAQVQYLLSILGNQGIDTAGGLDAVEGDCSACGRWAREFDFGYGQEGWTNTNPGDVGIWAPSAWFSSNSGGNTTLIIRCTLPVTSGWTIKRVHIEYYRYNANSQPIQIGSGNTTFYTTTGTAVGSWITEDTGFTLNVAAGYRLAFYSFRNGNYPIAVRNLRVWGEGSLPFPAYQGREYNGP